MATGWMYRKRGFMKSSFKSLTFRLLIAAGLWTVIGLFAGGLALSSSFRKYAVRNFDGHLSDTLDAMVGSIELSEDGTINLNRALGDQRFLQPYSGWYWQISAAGVEPLRSRSLWDQELEPDLTHPDFSGHTYLNKGPNEETLRILERDILLPDSDVRYRFIVAGDSSEIDADVDEFNRLLFRSLSALGMGLLVAIALQIGYGLRPLRFIRRGLAAIRSGNAQRLSDDFPPEIMPLVSEVNALLEHNEAVVERARTHVGNLAHALKTPLSVIINEAEAKSSGNLAETVQKQSTIMRRHIDHHLARARAAGRSKVIGVRADTGKAIADLIRVMARIYQEKDLTFDTECEEGLFFWGERQDLDEMLGNLLDNACKWAKSQVRVTAKKTGNGNGETAFKITIEDDGPGIPESERDRLFERGRRMDETVPGSGLGLAIVKDIAQLCGGSVRLEASPLGGLKANVTLPLSI